MSITKWLALAALAATPVWAEEWNKRFTVSGKADLRIDINDGGITVNSWDRNEIEARVSTNGWTIGPHEVRVTDRQNGDRVEIEVRIPRQNWNNIFGSNRRVHIDLRVPRALRADIRSGDGRITADGLQGEIRLASRDGSIEANNMDGDLEATTGDGRIRASGRWDNLNLRTGDGSIEADIQRGSKMSAGWHIHTGDGHITLRVAETFAADLDAHSGDGKVTVDLPAAIQGSMRSSEFRGKLNGGGAPLVVRTNDGTIRLERF